MSYSNLLDDSIIYGNLNTNFILDHSRKIANRVLILSFFFFCFCLSCSPVTLEAFGKMGRNTETSFYLLAALSTQLGTLYLSRRLFVYQRSIRKKQDWVVIFNAKYKVWRTFAFVFLISLTYRSIPFSNF